VSTIFGNTGNLLEFFIPLGNTGNLLEFSWSSWKFLTDGITTKESSQKNLASLQSSCLEGGDYIYISYDGYVYLVNRITDLRDYCFCSVIVR